MVMKKTAEQDSEELSRILRTAPPGAWVALSHDKTRVLGTGVSIQAAAYQAQLRGEHFPVLIKTPMEDEEMAAGAH